LVNRSPVLAESSTRDMGISSRSDSIERASCRGGRLLIGVIPILDRSWFMELSRTAHMGPYRPLRRKLQSF
jgi:hypothetical protein